MNNAKTQYVEPSSNSIGHAIETATKVFNDAKIDNPAFEAKLLMQHCIDESLAFLISHSADALSSAQHEQFFQWVNRRYNGEPIAYIVGETGFWDLNLYCNSSTLIPRSDTEILVEWALSLPLPNDASVLDLGTGTGAIALSLASQHPGWMVTGVDVVMDAVVLAKRNAERNQLDATFLQSDWFASLQHQKFDLIVSNPPYVEENSPYLHKGDLRYEPQTALVSGQCGLADIRTIIDNAKDYLTNNGWLLIEHGHKQALMVQSELKQKQYIQIETRKDLNSLDRVTGGCNSFFRR